jgi:hypothetical protein
MSAPCDQSLRHKEASVVLQKWSKLGEASPRTSLLFTPSRHQQPGGTLGWESISRLSRLFGGCTYPRSDGLSARRRVLLGYYSSWAEDA